MEVDPNVAIIVLLNLVSVSCQLRKAENDRIGAVIHLPKARFQLAHLPIQCVQQAEPYLRGFGNS